MKFIFIFISIMLLGLHSHAQYQITTQATMGGIIDTNITVSADTTIRVQYAANIGFYIDSVIVNDTTIATDSVTGYTFYNIQSNQKIRVVFKMVCLNFNQQTSYYDSAFHTDSILITAPNCKWQLRSNATWLRLLNPVDSGTKYLKYTILANTDTLPFRTAQIVIGSISKSITQFIGKRYYFIFTAANAGGVYDDTLFIKQDTNFRVHFQPDSGYYIDSVIINNNNIANDSVEAYTFYNVDTNQSIRIVFAPFCATINTQTMYYDSAAHLDSILVEATNCKWRASSSASWLRLLQPKDTGTRYLRYQVMANSDTVNRVAFITVGNKRFAVEQFLGKKFFFVDIEANVGGFIDAPNTSIVENDSSFVINYQALNSFIVDSVWLNGNYVADSADHFTINNINRNHQFKVQFKYAPSDRFITIQNGQISPVGIHIKPDTTIRFSYLPDSGYTFDYVVANGKIYKDSTTHFTLDSIDYDSRLGVYFKPIGNTITVTKTYKGIDKIDSVVTNVYPDTLILDSSVVVLNETFIDSQVLSIDSNLIVLKLTAPSSFNNYIDTTFTKRKFVAFSDEETLNNYINLYKGKILISKNSIANKVQSVFHKVEDVRLNLVNKTVELITHVADFLDAIEELNGKPIPFHFNTEGFPLSFSSSLSLLDPVNKHISATLYPLIELELEGEGEAIIEVKNHLIRRFKIICEFKRKLVKSLNVSGKGKAEFDIFDINLPPKVAKVPPPLFLIGPVPFFAKLSLKGELEAFAQLSIFNTSYDTFNIGYDVVYGNTILDYVSLYPGIPRIPQSISKISVSKPTRTVTNLEATGNAGIEFAAKLAFEIYPVVPGLFNINFFPKLILKAEAEASSLTNNIDASAILELQAGLGIELKLLDKTLLDPSISFPILEKEIWKKRLRGYPILNTWEPYNATATSIVIGNSVEDFASGIDEKGFCINTTPNLNVCEIDKKISSGLTAKTTEFTLTNLTPNTTYYYRPYAKNRFGTGYGEQVSFTTAKATDNPNSPKYNITTYITNGTITATQMATKGSNVVITYTATNGFKIVAVSINGIKQSGASVYGQDSMRGTYTIKNVTANTTLNVVCQTINSNTLPLPPVGAGLSLANLEANMITVPGGSFTMGATSEQLTNNGDGFSVHWSPSTQQVTLSSYKICRFEVTQQLWLDVMGTNPSYFTGDLQRPVEQVSWYDCQAFITKLNQLTGKSYRLPTEAEWEYAARGGASTITSYIYSGSNTLNNVAWYSSNSGSTTQPVGTKQANALGIFDMSGNV
ncbi:MAG: SUMF1/EgtB/PvdO family nonheme iron enzyme, partial [Alphaproteobacteria bacterium]|nr:SUMF1/EgtB/PvdO family nonheme iron enzyme [Alphaproteobacteria bacterium]